jgi:hypothetical protein
MDNDRPYVIESPSRIRLGVEAKAWAQEFGMSLEDMGRHLLAQERLRDSGMTQRNGEN